MLGINNDLASLTTQRFNALNALAVNQTLYRLATANRINSAADDPAGLIASESLRSTLVSVSADTDSAERVYNQGATAEGALDQVSSLLIDANSLALANANSSGLSEAEKQANQLQLDSILSSVDRISRTTSFAGRQLLDGTNSLSMGSSSVALGSVAVSQLGNTEIDGEDFSLADLRSGGALAATGQRVGDAQAVIGAALKQVNDLRGQVGAFQKNTLDTQVRSLHAATESMTAAVSVIRDTDYAAESAALWRNQLLQQTGLRTLAMGQMSASNVMFLLGGSGIHS